jgi:hypothetical protein
MNRIFRNCEMAAARLYSATFHGHASLRRDTA